MDLRQLDSFVHVAEMGSFSRAASQLSVAQSALSHRVRQLEVELKQPLLYRNGRGVVPTEAGKRLLVHARGILMQVNRTREELEQMRGTAAGHVVVGLPPTFARLLGLPLVKGFRSRFPGATIATVEGLTASVVEWIAMGRVDIGVVYNPGPSPAIEIAPLMDEPMYLVSAKAPRGPRGALPLRELPRYPLIVPSRPNANRMRIEWQLARMGLKPSIALEIDGIAILLQLVAEGMGHAALPLTSVRSHGRLEDFVLRPIVKPRLHIQVALVTSAQRPATPLTQQVLGFLAELASALLPAKQPG